MTVSIRKHDEERIMLVLDHCRRTYSDASRALATVSELADLIDEIRHETIEKCRDEVIMALALVSNGAMTSERLRRLLAADSSSPSEGG